MKDAPATGGETDRRMRQKWGEKQFAGQREERAVKAADAIIIILC